MQHLYIFFSISGSWCFVAPRDLYHRHGCRLFRSTKLMLSRLYAIYVAVGEIIDFCLWLYVIYITATGAAHFDP
jgi:hypothetical protein